MVCRARLAAIGDLQGRRVPAARWRPKTCSTPYGLLVLMMPEIVTCQ
jgi:hypothetical protein